MDTAELLPIAVKQGSAEGACDRSGQLLDAMHQVCSHDLPNQLIIVQSFINLLEMEEKRGLTNAAQEYLTRLAGAARRAGVMVQFLKDMARANHLQEPIETIELIDFVRELRAELTQRLPARRLSFDGNWTVAAVRAGRRSLQQALLKVLRCGIELCPTAEVVVQLMSRKEAPWAQLEIVVARDGVLNPTQQFLFRDDGPQVENRLEIHLARALAATWGGTLEVTPGRSEFSVCLHFPSMR